MLTGSIRGRWKLGKRIGKGGFGEIYLSRDLKTKQCVAIKFEKNEQQKQTLNLEAAVLCKLQVSAYAPKFIYCGSNLRYNYLIMELLGNNLSVERRRRPERRFSLATTIKLGIEMIAAIEDMHLQGFVHRDIKPSNFVLRSTNRVSHRNKQSGYSTNQIQTPTTICMIDFGLSRRYRHNDGNLRAPRPKVGFRGTARYASINSHKEKELSRRDDLWSLLYVFVEFLKGELPWSKIKDKLILEKLKSKFNSPSLVKGLPEEFLKILEHVQSLKYEDTPNYNYLRQLLTDAYYEAGYDENTKFDWEIGKNKRGKSQKKQTCRWDSPRYQHKKNGYNMKKSQYLFQQKSKRKKQLLKRINTHKTMSDVPPDSNYTRSSFNNLPHKKNIPKNNNQKKKLFSKKFLNGIQKMNQIVIPSHQELLKRKKNKTIYCLKKLKTNSSQMIQNRKKKGLNFYDLIKSNSINNNNINEKNKRENNIQLQTKKQFGKNIKGHKNEKGKERKRKNIHNNINLKISSKDISSKKKKQIKIKKRINEKESFETEIVERQFCRCIIQ
ncbi:tau-tubulin kinase 1 [Anaeramoeba flamelloides]|uniref:non-specific serine/threonine protein kinase n=1 Tax=Anaeramoeba flamelloides TaxID=1746091 RepID=A0ABQ8XKK2_9EUKA|nr:tau-tubulin kinase 1 [Anaeramoeba flamelloides]